MNDLVKFDFEGHVVRTVMIDGEPWWVLRDVCEVLGLGSPHKVAERLETDERNQIPVIDSIGRAQDTEVVNESGLYAVILRSDKPEAKAFRKWITSVVLPEIRRKGSFNAAPALPDFTKPAEAARAWADQFEARAKAEALVALAAPKLESHAALMRSESNMSITEASKHFGLHPRVEVFPYLRAKGYLTREDLPTQAAIDAGYLSLKETKAQDGRVWPQAVVEAWQLETWRAHVVHQIKRAAAEAAEL